MKLCRVAAVSLLGWYFMTPPLGSLSGGKVIPGEDKFIVADSDTPVVKWEIDASYDTAKECEAAKQAAQASLLTATRRQDEMGLVPPGGFKSPYNFVYAFLLSQARGRCIATDDPRLMGKTKK